MVIQAVCIDGRKVPQPASRVHAERDVDDAYEGELFRCIAGTRMQATIAKFNGEVRFDGGQIIDCSKNQELYRSAHGEVAYRDQIPESDCNERSLLRRYGAGVKVLTDDPRGDLHRLPRGDGDHAREIAKFEHGPRRRCRRRGALARASTEKESPRTHGGKRLGRVKNRA